MRFRRCMHCLNKIEIKQHAKDRTPVASQGHRMRNGSHKPRRGRHIHRSAEIRSESRRRQQHKRHREARQVCAQV